MRSANSTTRPRRTRVRERKRRRNGKSEQAGTLPGIRPFNRCGAIRDAVAGFELEAMKIPQALGYTKIAGTTVVTGFYTLLLPLVAFATFGSSAIPRGGCRFCCRRHSCGRDGRHSAACD